MKALDVLAGPEAMAHLREKGLKGADVAVVPAASGGPKWLVLAGLDRVLFGDFLRREPRPGPLHCIGSSIGGWRLACLLQRDPGGALDRFQEAYIEQRYPPKPSPQLVSRTSEGIVDALLGSRGAAEIFAHPWARLSVVATLCLGALASERRGVLGPALAAAAAANAFSRRSLGWRMRRALFHTAGKDTPFPGLADLPTLHIPLSADTLAPALLASGSIPLLMTGMRVPGAPPGVYRDGGLLDYHLDLDFGVGEGLVLYPHFYPHVTPGWFDRGPFRRRARPEHWRRAVLLAPSAEFVASLPRGKIPDRRDFYDLNDGERIAAWRRVAALSGRLGEEFAELLNAGRMAGRARPLVP